MPASGLKSLNLEPLLSSLKHAAATTICKEQYMASAELTQRAVAELRNELEKTLACTLRDRNSRTPVGRVPPELWLYVWKYASFDDMVAIARVCHGWRSLAHAHSALWTRVEVHSSLHHNGCDCDECHTSLALAGVTNLGPARNALQLLSKSRPIILTAAFAHGQTNEIFLARLQGCIALSASRLVELTIAYDDELITSSLLGAVDVFPALRTLKMGCLDPTMRHEPIPFLSRGAQFPALRDLDTGPYLSWPDPEDLEGELNLPAIRDLTCTFGTPYDIGLALKSCAVSGSDRLANLRLHWRLNAHAPEMFAIDGLLNNVLDALHNVRISNLSAAQEEATLANFARCRREYLQLGYVDRTVALGLRACRNLELAAGLELLCMRVDGTTVEIDVADSQNAVEIAFPASPAGRATINWDVVPQYLTSLTVDAALWDDVLHGLPPAPKLKNITLRVADDACLEQVRPSSLGDSAAWVFAPDLSLRLQNIAPVHGKLALRSTSVERVRSLLKAESVSFHGVLVRD